MNQITIINVATGQPFPNATVAGRMCYAVPQGARFAVVVTPLPPGALCGPRHEIVLAVDGRDTLTNRDADPELRGIVMSGQSYTCRGFRISQTEVREFVCEALGLGQTTAERNGSASSTGLIAAAIYRERHRDVYSGHRGGLESFGGEATRGVTRGASVGAAAGERVQDRVGTTSFTRDGTPPVMVVAEYDTLESWRARGIVIPEIGCGDPWPGRRSNEPVFSDDRKL